MLGRQAWRLIQEPNSLWSQILKGVYFPRGQFWQAGKGPRPSWGWQSLLMGRDTIEPNVIWIVGDDKRIKTREDKWLPSGKIGGPVNLSEPQTVDELINQESHEWKSQLIIELCEENVAREIMTIPLSQHPTEDKLVWTGNRGGTYTVKGGYNKLSSQIKQGNQNQASASYQPLRNLWTKMWQLKVYPKVRFFLWSVCNNALLTKENLYRRKMATSPLCPLCRRAPETPEHLVILCEWLGRVWSDTRLKWDTSPTKNSRMDR